MSPAVFGGNTGSAVWLPLLFGAIFVFVGTAMLSSRSCGRSPR